MRIGLLKPLSSSSPTGRPSATRSTALKTRWATRISPAAAAYQVPRVARARGLSESQVRAMVAMATTGRQFGVLGEPRVNVLRLNLALDGH